MCNNSNACWQHNVRHVQGLAGNDVGQVNSNELWQVSWQAGDIQFNSNVADDCCVQFNGWGNVSVNEMQRHFNVDLLVRINTLEISVQYQLFVCVDLEVAQQYFFYFAVYFQIQDGGVEHFFFQCMVQRIVVQSDRDRGFCAAVDDARCLASIAQAAARSGPLLFACKCDYFHFETP